MNFSGLTQYFRHQPSLTAREMSLSRPQASHDVEVHEDSEDVVSRRYADHQPEQVIYLDGQRKLRQLQEARLKGKTKALATLIGLDNPLSFIEQTLQPYAAADAETRLDKLFDEIIFPSASQTLENIDSDSDNEMSLASRSRQKTQASSGPSEKALTKTGLLTGKKKPNVHNSEKKHEKSTFDNLKSTELHPSETYASLSTAPQTNTILPPREKAFSRDLSVSKSYVNGKPEDCHSSTEIAQGSNSRNGNDLETIQNKQLIKLHREVAYLKTLSDVKTYKSRDKESFLRNFPMPQSVSNKIIKRCVQNELTLIEKLHDILNKNKNIALENIDYQDPQLREASNNLYHMDATEGLDDAMRFREKLRSSKIKRALQNEHRRFEEQHAENFVDDQSVEDEQIHAVILNSCLESLRSIGHTNAEFLGYIDRKPYFHSPEKDCYFRFSEAQPQKLTSNEMAIAIASPPHDIDLSQYGLQHFPKVHSECVFRACAARLETQDPNHTFLPLGISGEHVFFYSPRKGMFACVSDSIDGIVELKHEDFFNRYKHNLENMSFVDNGERLLNKSNELHSLHQDFLKLQAAFSSKNFLPICRVSEASYFYNLENEEVMQVAKANEINFISVASLQKTVNNALAQGKFVTYDSHGQERLQQLIVQKNNIFETKCIVTENSAHKNQKALRAFQEDLTYVQETYPLHQFIPICHVQQISYFYDQEKGHFLFIQKPRMIKKIPLRRLQEILLDFRSPRQIEVYDRRGKAFFLSCISKEKASSVNT